MRAYLSWRLVAITKKALAPILALKQNKIPITSSKRNMNTALTGWHTTILWLCVLDKILIYAQG
jgi:hypothetical protein